jgi:uncharacterized protein YcbK (DUF882 family)
MTWIFENFTRDEFKCQCGCGAADVDYNFVATLQKIRTAYGRSLTVSSGYRCPEHNANVSSTGLRGPHTTGKAVDIRISGSDALSLMKIALAEPLITGAGIQQKGPWSSRFIHLDTLTAEDPGKYPRPHCWSY